MLRETIILGGWTVEAVAARLEQETRDFGRFVFRHESEGHYRLKPLAERKRTAERIVLVSIGHYVDRGGKTSALPWIEPLVFDVVATPEAVQVFASCDPHDSPPIEYTFERLVSILEEMAAEQAEPHPETPEPAGTEVGEWAGKPGHPGLSHEELIYRLAKAQEAEAIRASSEEQGETKTWRQIAQEIGWKYGYSARGLALLRDARQRLRRVVNARDEELLREIAEF